VRLFFTITCGGYWMLAFFLYGTLLVPPLLLYTQFFDRNRRAFRAVSRNFARFFWAAAPGVSLAHEGFRKADFDSPAVIVCNHQSAVDIIALLSLPGEFRFVAKRRFFRMPFLGWVLQAGGDIMAGAEGGFAGLSGSRTFAEARLCLASGISVLVFPEGTRSRDGSLQRFKTGPFRLAAEAGVDVLPLVIDGTADIIPKGRLSISKPRATIAALPRVPTSTYRDPSGPSRLRDRVRELIAAKLAELRSRGR
jgi:1-acyl-sn-glycerol-3-phosphate acyltransferase